MTEAEDKIPESFKSWALVEIMGHRKRAGLCEDVALFGTRMLRVDVPNAGDVLKFTTEFYGGPSIYALHPCSEAIGRRLAKEYVYHRAIDPAQEEPPKETPALSYRSSRVGRGDDSSGFEFADDDQERG